MYRSYALVPPSWLRRLQAADKYFGDPYKRAVLDTNERAEQIIADTSTPPYEKKARYAEAMNELNAFKAKVKPKSDIPAVDSDVSLQEHLQPSSTTEAAPQSAHEQSAAAQTPPLENETAAATESNQEPAAADIPSKPSTSAAAAQQADDENFFDTEEEVNVEANIKSFIDALPLRSKIAAQEAYDKLLASNEMEIHPDYSVSFKGELLPKSDIRELLRRHTKPPTTRIVPGMTEFKHMISGCPPGARRFCDVSRLR